MTFEHRVRAETLRQGMGQRVWKRSSCKPSVATQGHLGVSVTRKWSIEVSEEDREEGLDEVLKEPRVMLKGCCLQ